MHALLDCALKATLLLILTLLLAVVFRRASAATRHLVWTLGLSGLLLLPIIALVAPAWQLAVLPDTAPPPPVTVSNAESLSPAHSPWQEPRVAPAVPDTAPAVAAMTPAPAEPTPAATPTPASVPALAISWPMGLLLAWGIGTCVVLWPLPLGIARLWLLAQRCRRVEDGPWLDAHRDLSRQLGLSRPPVLLCSPTALMPMTWGITRPVVVLPEAADGWPVERRRMVLLHELAHVKRRDCLMQVLARIACALYWFHPLAWLAAAQIRKERELACDDQVLDAGSRASDYAGHLLTVARTFRSTRGVSCAAVAITRPSQLEDRLMALLDGRRDRRRPGRVLTAVACALLVALVAPLAALQFTIRAADPAPKGDKPKGDQKEYRASGIIRDGMGKPLAGATVYWIVMNDSAMHPAALPKDAVGGPRADLLGTATTDAEGQFRLETSLPADDRRLTESFAVVAARAPGLAFTGTLYRPDRKFELTLASEIPIEGKLLTPNGEPAKGVKVRVEGFMQIRSAEPLEGWGLTSPVLRDGKVTDLPDWPAGVTGDDGQFTLHGLGKGVVAQLQLTSEQYGTEDLQVVSRDGLAGLMDKMIGRNPSSVEPKFSHALDTARPVQGVVTDATTEKPLTGVLVQVTAMRNYQGRPLTTHTDGQGRYRISGPIGDSYWFSVHPAGDAGYLGVQEDDPRGWPAGAKVLEKNFALKKGRVIRGRVVDEDAGQPVARAAVVYRVRRDNSNQVRNASFDNPVLTDADGRFALTGYAGEGFVVVGAPGADYVRRTVSRADTKAGEDWLPHGFAAVTAPQDGEAGPVEVKVRKGVLLEVKAVDPEGKPLPYVNAFCREQQARGFDYYSNFGGEPTFGGLFRMRGAEPGRTYRLFFAQADRGLAKALEVKVPADSKGQSLEVRLEPAAKIKAKVVRADGSSVEDGDVVASLLVTGEQGEVKPDELYGSPRVLWYSNFARTLLGGSGLKRTNAKGEFECECLVPGTRNFLHVGTRNEGKSVQELPELKPGETRDLGTIRLKKEEP